MKQKKKVILLALAILGICVLLVMIISKSMIETWTWPIVNFLPGSSWFSLTSQDHHENAFIVTSAGDFRWLRLELRINNERAGEGAVTGIKLNDKSLFPGIYDLGPGDMIYIENIGAPIKVGDEITVLYDGVELKSICA